MGGMMAKRLWALVALLLVWAAPALAGPEPAEVVTVGVYPTVVDDLNIAASTYDVVAYVWFKWKGPVDPTEGLEFANASERQNFVQQKLFEAPRTLADGSSYQLLQIHGRFFQPFSLIDFPFDRQMLSLVIADEINAAHRIVYVPDLKESGIGANLQIPGWRLLGWHAEAGVQDYATHFGAPGLVEGTRHPSLRFAIAIERPPSFFLWKLFLPLLIVMFANWLAFLIKPDLVDVRTALTATALLTLVFLQKSYSDELPEIGTLVLMDKIYAVAYLLVIATLAQVVRMASWQKSSGVPDERVMRLDRISFAVHIGFFALAVGALVLSAGRGIA